MLCPALLVRCLSLLAIFPADPSYERFLQLLVVYCDGIVCFTSGDTTKLLEDAALLKPEFFPGVPRVWNK